MLKTKKQGGINYIKKIYNKYTLKKYSNIHINRLIDYSKKNRNWTSIKQFKHVVSYLNKINESSNQFVDDFKQIIQKLLHNEKDSDASNFIKYIYKISIDDDHTILIVQQIIIISYYLLYSNYLFGDKFRNFMFIVEKNNNLESNSKFINFLYDLIMHLYENTPHNNNNHNIYFKFHFAITKLLQGVRKIVDNQPNHLSRQIDKIVGQKSEILNKLSEV